VSRARYFREFNVVELQSTFYQLPKLSTAFRWREEAPTGFEFTVKAWQAITHPLLSPTWRRVKARPDLRDRAKYGLLRPTRQNFEAWDATLAICRSLGAKLCLVQSPPQFSHTAQNLRNLKEFFANIDRAGINIAWEPRGNWTEKPQEIRGICERFELVHCVDLLKRVPAHLADIGYFRLHGVGRKDTNYSYHYTGLDFSQLSERLRFLAARGLSCAYMMFNNIAMFDDARRFLRCSSSLSK